MAVVLIADNDPGVRGLLAEVVRRQGCSVLDVADGEAARTVLRSQPIDVLVCDLDMPRLPGQDLLAWLGGRAEQPAVIVVSGYLDAKVAAAIQRWPFVRHVLRKPFDVMAFGALVREVAATARGGGVAPATGSPLPPAPGDGPPATDMGPPGAAAAGQ